MTELTVLELGRNAITMILLLSAPMLIVALVVGLVISLVQALTQLNEVTLSYVPKILAVFAVLALAGPWLVSTLLSYTVGLFSALPNFAR
ncbi:MAG TPA: flagellar biosynthesis protein FliQ [Chloroflexota bacterium]|jgi:flagellar biosynthetic protein FliQ|nr:flagellar biosynthesis protein FliQ [Chloroflexota bacterium]